MDNKKQNSKLSIIPQHGGYRNLKSYKAAEIIYDATVALCEGFIDKRLCTHDHTLRECDIQPGHSLSAIYPFERI